MATFWPIRAVALSWGVVGVFYGFTGSSPSRLILLGAYFTLLTAAGIWLQADARVHRVGLMFDWGLLACAAWPILLPVYAYHTRGWNGWRLVVYLFGAMFARELGTAVGMLGAIFVGAPR